MTYRGKVINIEERPSLNLTKPSENEVQQYDAQRYRMRKIAHPPNFVMEATTFEGLKQHRECINIRMRQLEESVAFVNHTRSSIMDFLKEELTKEETERAKQILKDGTSFKHYFTLRLSDIIVIMKSKIIFFNVNQTFAYSILAEIYSLGLSAIAKDIYQFMIEE